MARFAKCAEVLMVINVGMATLFMFGPGLVMPPATSVSPPSICIVQAAVYQGIGRLQTLMVGPLLASMLLCGVAMVDLAVSGNSTITGMHLIARRLLRGCIVLALLFSAVVVALGLRVYGYVLEAKVMAFSCLPVADRFWFISSYALTAVVCAYVFLRFLWVVMCYD